MEKEEKLLPRSNFSSFHNILSPVVKFSVKTGTRFSLRDKRLFEIREAEITRVDCITYIGHVKQRENAYEYIEQISVSGFSCMQTFFYFSNGIIFRGYWYLKIAIVKIQYHFRKRSTNIENPASFYVRPVRKMIPVSFFARYV